MMKLLIKYRCTTILLILALAVIGIFIATLNMDIQYSRYRLLLEIARSALFPYFAIITIVYGDPHSGNLFGPTVDVIWFLMGMLMTIFLYGTIGWALDRGINRSSAKENWFWLFAVIVSVILFIPLGWIIDLYVKGN